MADKITLDQAALHHLIQSEAVGSAVGAAAQKVADNIRSQGITVGSEDGGIDEVPLPVTVYGPELGKARPIGGIQGYAQAKQATVTLSHAAGVAVQAKHGSLTKAAAAAGLRVKVKGGGGS